MLAFSRRLISALSSKFQKRYLGDSKKEIIDFSRTKKSPFNIKADSPYNANLSNGAFEMNLLKSNCIAWAAIPENEYQDHVIKAKFRLDSLGGYAAAGIIFRIMDEDSYYLTLISSKGYFRLDAVKNNSPKTLIAWTEIPDFNEAGIDLEIITYGASLIFIVNGNWLCETNDNSIAEGCLGFALASYLENKGQKTKSKEPSGKAASRVKNKEQIGNDGKTAEENGDKIFCRAYLDYISVDTRLKTIEDSYKKWTDDSNINAEYRLRLAETFAVMDEPAKAVEQISKAWKRRDEVIRSVSAAAAEVRTKKELLLAARMSFRLGQFGEAEEFIDAILDHWPDSAEGKTAYTEKLKILNELNKFEELKKFALKHQSKINKDIEYYLLLAGCHWKLKDYAASAKVWDKVFSTNTGNGVYAANAAYAHELAGGKEEALARFITAGKIFLNQDNMAELAAIMPKLAFFGKDNWEARALSGKWLFSIEDYDKCEQEFTASDKLRSDLKPKPDADPAVYYLWGLVYYIRKKYKSAVRLLEKAVKLAPDYELFQTKLEEVKAASKK